MEKKRHTIFLGGRPVEIVGGDYNGDVIVKRQFVGADEIKTTKEMLRSEGGYLEIYNQLKAIKKGGLNNE